MSGRSQSAGRHLSGGHARGHPAGTRADRCDAPPHRRLRAAGAAGARPWLRRWRPRFGNRPAPAAGRSGAGGFLGADAGGRQEAILRGRRPAHFVLADYGVPSWTASVAEWSPYDAIVSGFSIHHQPDDRKRAVYRRDLRTVEPRRGLRQHRACLLAHRLARVARPRDVHRLAPPPSPRPEPRRGGPALL